MKTIECKEIIIDLTKSDERSGSTTLAKILTILLKQNGVDVEYAFSDKVKGIMTSDRIDQYNRTSINIDSLEELNNLLKYYKLQFRINHQVCKLLLRRLSNQIE